jgi:hypothetical protein
LLFFCMNLPPAGFKHDHYGLTIACLLTKVPMLASV